MQIKSIVLENTTILAQDNIKIIVQMNTMRYY